MSFLNSAFKNQANALDSYSKGTTIKANVIPIEENMFKEETGFGIYTVEDAESEERKFMMLGTFITPLTAGQTYHVEGYVTEFRGLKQLSIKQIRNVRPVNKKGIVAYLQTLKGLKTKAELIYEEFGEESIDVLMKDPMMVAGKVRGIGQKSVIQWQKQLDKMKDSQDVITTLLGYGLTVKQARKLHVLYKDDIIGRIEQNPYCLAKEVRGYSFERCDRIARNMGFNPKSPFRIQEGLLHTLEEASQSGHCYLPMDILSEQVKELLTIRLTHAEMRQLIGQFRQNDVAVYQIGEQEIEIPLHDLREAVTNYEGERNKKEKETHRYPIVDFSMMEFQSDLDELVDQKRIVIDNEKVYIRQYYLEELVVAGRVNILTNTIPFERSLDLENVLERYCSANGYVLEEKQKEAVLTFSKERGGVYILNGSAGCGKTFTLKIILKMLEKQFEANDEECVIKVFAPTGKASKVAAKSTQRECTTIHRGLGFNPAEEGFEFNAENPLEAHVVVVDESSMLDVSLASDLLTAIAKGTKVILLGDTKQLPSVGAGNVLKDLIESGVPTVVTLNVVKRQGALSGIVRNANRIIGGEMIHSCNDTKDAFIVQRATPESAVKGILESMKRLLSMSDYSLEDIQILAPQRKGSVGTYFLNYVVQREFNPGEDGLTILNRKFDVVLDQRKGTQSFSLFFKKGDKVIHVKNSYDKVWYVQPYEGYFMKDPTTIGITNGECGVVEDIIKVKEKGDTVTRIIVKYEGKYVFYDDDFDQLDHAWALTIHKSQGSQWKALILPMMNQYYQMLDNNLFYTGYTRAELFNVVVGQEYAVRHAINTYKTRNRYTGLADKIKIFAEHKAA